MEEGLFMLIGVSNEIYFFCSRLARIRNSFVIVIRTEFWVMFIASLPNWQLWAKGL